MHSRVRQALEYCRAARIRRAVFVIPFELSAMEAAALRADPCCAAVVTRDEYSSDGLAWRLPEASGTIVFLGAWLMLTRRMRAQIRGRGQRVVPCVRDGAFCAIPLAQFQRWAAKDRVVRWLGGLGPKHPVVRGVHAARRVGALRRAWHGVMQREAPPASESGDDLLAFYRTLLVAARAAEPKIDPVPRRVILVNAGLAAGGAERQILNTLVGLADRGLESACLLGEHLDAPGLDFYRAQFQAAGAQMFGVKRRLKLWEHGLATVPPALAELIAQLPIRLIEDILNLTEAFRERRPEVVHAWQDATSIRCAIAGLIAGVPRLVLSARNVNPTNFDYGQPYMRPAYRALAELENVALANNSNAGAEDYARWLGLPRARFIVVRNGLDLERMRPAPAHAVAAYRAELGIPANAPVVGAVFRFWEEKRPMLWLEVARRIAASVPNTHFLLIGDGTARTAMESFVRKTGLIARCHMPGTIADVAPALGAMTVFLLTSVFEGTPNVVIEAQCAGVPVVATDAGGTRDAVEDGVTGKVLATDDAEVIADTVIGVLFDEDFRRTAAKRGPAFVGERFALGRMIDETLAMYGYSPGRRA
jgi:glycosyltransferase involved in cell wall biosynthesis